MSERSTQHATFVIERTYEASPSRAFAAWGLDAVLRNDVATTRTS